MGCCMECKKCAQKPASADKWRYTLWTTLVFFIIVNPVTYQLTHKVFRNLLGPFANATTGCPSTLGIVVHGIVFTLVLRLLMEYDI